MLRRHTSYSNGNSGSRARLREDLKLYDVLKMAGTPNPVGSLATGLMVWRDIDFTVVCDNLDIGVVTDIATSLATHPNVRPFELRNDGALRNEEASIDPNGLFIGIEYVADEVSELDIWVLDDLDPQPDLAQVSNLSQR